MSDEIERLRAELAQSRDKCQAAEDTLAMSVPKFKYDELAESLDLAITKAEEAEAEVIKLRAEVDRQKEVISKINRTNDHLGMTVRDIKKERNELRAELAALKAQQGEPVAEVNEDGVIVVCSYTYKPGDKLYTAPPSTAPLIEALKQARVEIVKIKNSEHGSSPTYAFCVAALAAIDAVLPKEE